MFRLSMIVLSLCMGAVEMAGAELTIDGTQFALDGKPTFLLGVSYYGALGAPEDFIRRDLDDMQRCGFNWIRIWATWAAFENDISAVDADGNGREPCLTRLENLVAECRRRGIVVDVTLSRGNGVTGPARLQSIEAMMRAVETLAAALKDHPNWYLDLSNERNIRDRRFTSFEDLKHLRDKAKQLDPKRMVTASHAGDIGPEDLREYLLNVQVDFISPHRPRNGDSPERTAQKTREYLAQMKTLGRIVPVHYQEPFRRGFRPKQWEPSADAFLTDLRQAVEGGAAGWCFHNGDQRDRPEAKPRRSFDMRQERLFDQLDEEERRVLEVIRTRNVEWGSSTPATGGPRPLGRTRISIVKGKWHINGEVTYPGTRAEGLLMNVRMVNAVFEDRDRRDFDAEANTETFLARIPDYAGHGVRAFTLCLQGGFPGYEGAVNSAFNPDGSLRETYMRRVRRVVETCDRHGIAVILGCYYQRQDQILQDETAVHAGVVHVARWIQENLFSNVLLEIANEFPHRGFDHPILKTPEGQVELLRLAKQTAPDLLVSTSGIGDGRLPGVVAEASDFLLIHFNGVALADIPDRIQSLRGFGKPIVCNEDDKIGEEAAQAAELSVANGASWGFMQSNVNQYFPLTFNGAGDDPVVYARLGQLTSP